MATQKKSTSKANTKYRPPMSQDAEDAEMIALAYDQARNMMREGTAPAPMVLFFLKKGSDKEKLELEKLKEENKLLIAKTEALQGAKRTEEMLSDYIDSLRLYQGVSTAEEEEPDEPY